PVSSYYSGNKGTMGGDFNYGKDDKHVFWNDSIIPGADAASFEKVDFPDGDSWTVFDRNRVYKGKDSPKLREYLKKKYGKLYE
ncbi:DKNYY domain-containing protein, partial [Klebsiella pneumoniae]|nr:DKNYY domain-containing protein [Klebsiella pneumoniae]